MTHAQFMYISGGFGVAGKKMNTNARSKYDNERMLIGSPMRPSEYLVGGKSLPSKRR